MNVTVDIETDGTALCCVCGALIENNVIEVVTITKVVETPIIYRKRNNTIVGDWNNKHKEVVSDTGTYSYKCSKCGRCISYEQLQQLFAIIKAR